MRWIRWSYVLPRVLLLVVVVLAVEMGAGTAAKYALVVSGQRAVGAKVEVAAARASVLRGKVALEGIQITNPRRPLENLVAADRLELDFETDAALRRKAIASRGVLRGLRFGTPRTTSGALPDAPAAEPADTASLDWLGNQAVDTAAQWMESLGASFQADLVDQFESVRLAEEIADRWPRKYADLETRAKTLKTKAAKLSDDVRQAQKNPLRHVDTLESLPREIKALDTALAELHAEVAALPDDVAADRRRILAARQHDETLVSEKLHVDTINSAALTAYFLRDQLSQPLADLVAWIRWSRDVASENLKQPEAVRRRGTDIEFAGCRKMPDLLVRQLELAGTARIGGQPVELSGTLYDVTTDPAVHGKPMRIELATTGSLPLTLAATIDRTGDVPRDTFQLNCHSVLLPAQKLGDADKLAVVVSPSTGSLAISLTIDGEQLAGHVALVQDHVKITSSAGAELARWQLDTALQQSLGRLNSLSTEVDLSGTLDAPQWELSSNLGPAVTDAVNLALEHAVRAKSQELVAQSQQIVDKQLASLDRLVKEKSAPLLAEIKGPTDELAQLADKATGGLSLDKLGRQLPINSLFR
jgi:uncharacterized protein (TIGR03545 family)